MTESPFKGPLTWYRQNPADIRSLSTVRDSNNYRVANDLTSKEATYLVRAVNTYPAVTELIAALDLMLSNYKGLTSLESDIVVREARRTIIDKASRALARVKEHKP